MRANPTPALVHDGTRTFAFFTVASPSRVWLALTDETQTPEYLYGLALSSEWSADAFITTASIQDLPGLTGQVLCAWPTRRLSYLLCAPNGPPVYLTWLIRPGPGGSICSLRIDETDGPIDSDEVEDTWLPVLDAFRRLLESTER